MKPTKEIKADPTLIARCGLYCGACRSFLKGSCPGCAENNKASWCMIRQCCAENSYQSCADCTLTDPMSCKKYNTFISRVIGFVFNSDRAACVARIRETGYVAFAAEMAAAGRQTMKKR